MPGMKRSGRRRTTATRGSWVRQVAQTSNAMDLPPGLFKRSARAIARGLKRSVEQSRRTKGTKFQSAMSMLNLYGNRAGRRMGGDDRRRLQAAKDELRKLFDRPTAGRLAGRAPRSKRTRVRQRPKAE
jgi:hypothetical protein